TEHGQPVGRQAKDFIQGFAERLRGLLRQSINEVDVDRLESRISQPVDCHLRLGKRLDAMHRLLNNWIVILHSDGGAVKADIAQRQDLVIAQPAWINLLTCLDIVSKLETFPDHITGPAQFAGIENRWRSSPKVQLCDFPIWIKFFLQ